MIIMIIMIIMITMIIMIIMNIIIIMMIMIISSSALRWKAEGSDDRDSLLADLDEDLASLQPIT